MQYNFKILIHRLKREEKRQRMINKILLRSGLIDALEYCERNEMYLDAIRWIDFLSEFLPYVVGHDIYQRNEQDNKPQIK